MGLVRLAVISGASRGAVAQINPPSQTEPAPRHAKIREPIVLDVGGGVIPTSSVVFHFISHLLFCHANRAFEGPVLPEVVQNSERQQYDG